MHHPNRRVPHPFAFFAKGWDSTLLALRGLLQTRNGRPRITVEGHGLSRAPKGLAAVARPGRGATSATRKPKVMTEKEQRGRPTQQMDDKCGDRQMRGQTEVTLIPKNNAGIERDVPSWRTKAAWRVHFFFRLFFSRALVPFVISPTRRSRRLRCFSQRASAAIRARRVRSSALEFFAYCRPPRLPRATAAGFFRFMHLLLPSHSGNAC